MSEIKDVGYTWMALNNFKCKHLLPLHIKGLNRPLSDLVVGGDACLACDTRVGEEFFVAFLAVRLVVAQYVALSDKTRATSTTTELAALPVLLQRLREVGGKQQLHH